MKGISKMSKKKGIIEQFKLWRKKSKFRAKSLEEFMILDKRFKKLEEKGVHNLSQEEMHSYIDTKKALELNWIRLQLHLQNTSIAPESEIEFGGLSFGMLGEYVTGEDALEVKYPTGILISPDQKNKMKVLTATNITAADAEKFLNEKSAFADWYSIYGLCFRNVLRAAQHYLTGLEIMSDPSLPLKPSQASEVTEGKVQQLIDYLQEKGWVSWLTQQMKIEDIMQRKNAGEEIEQLSPAIGIYANPHPITGYIQLWFTLDDDVMYSVGAYKDEQRASVAANKLLAFAEIGHKLNDYTILLKHEGIEIDYPATPFTTEIEKELLEYHKFKVDNLD